jgi:hypothetical protein
MAFPKETIALGASRTCDECGHEFKFESMHSGSGHYVGTRCDCGPYTRETVYIREHTADQLVEIMNTEGGLEDVRVLPYLRS